MVLERPGIRSAVGWGEGHRQQRTDDGPRAPLYALSAAVGPDENLGSGLGASPSFSAIFGEVGERGTSFLGDTPSDGLFLPDQ